MEGHRSRTIGSANKAIRRQESWSLRAYHPNEKLSLNTHVPPSPLANAIYMDRLGNGMPYTVEHSK